MAGVPMGSGCQSHVARKQDGFDTAGVDAPKGHDRCADGVPSPHPHGWSPCGRSSEHAADFVPLMRQQAMGRWDRLSRSYSLSETRPASAQAVEEAVDVFRQCGLTAA